MQQSFQNSEEHYRALAKNLDAVLFELDSQGYFTFVSPAIEKLTRYAVSEVMGLHFRQIVHPDDLLGVQLSIEQILGGSTQPHEFRVKNKNGDWRYMLLSSRAKLNAGKPSGITGVLSDITEHKLAVEALGKSEAYFRALTENASDLIMVLTPDGRPSYISPAFERITGYALGAEESQNILALIYPEDVLLAARLFTRAAGIPGYTGQEEIRLCHKDGSIHFTEIFCNNALDNPGVRGIIVSIHDVSARKQIQDKQRQMEDELQRSSRLASIGQLVAGVGHEINNPLTSIIGFAQLLERQILPEDAREKIKVISQEAKRIANIVQGLMTFARQEGIQKDKVDANALLDQILKLRSYELKAGNIQVIREFETDLAMIAGDVAQLQQVFLNLIMNAEEEIKAARGQGHIWIKTETIPEGIRLSIRDDGPGIRPENMDRIFTPFFTTRGVGEGTGLGLSICHGIISRHGGKIYAQSTFGKGAAFIVELPSIPAAGKPSRIKTAPDQKTAVIIIDDDRYSVQSLRALLEKEGYQSDTAEKASAAIAKLGSKKYAVIFLDVRMPGLSGLELYRRVQSADPDLIQSIIFLVDDINDTATRNFLEATQAEYLTQPFDVGDLKNKIARILEQQTTLYNINDEPPT